jgi:hypothetical protein
MKLEVEEIKNSIRECHDILQKSNDALSLKVYCGYLEKQITHLKIKLENKDNLFQEYDNNKKRNIYINNVIFINIFSFLPTKLIWINRRVCHRWSNLLNYKLLRSQLKLPHVPRYIKFQNKIELKNPWSCMNINNTIYIYDFKSKKLGSLICDKLSDVITIKDKIEIIKGYGDIVCIYNDLHIKLIHMKDGSQISEFPIKDYGNIEVKDIAIDSKHIYVLTQWRILTFDYDGKKQNIFCFKDYTIRCEKMIVYNNYKIVLDDYCWKIAIISDDGKIKSIRSHNEISRDIQIFENMILVSKDTYICAYDFNAQEKFRIGTKYLNISEFFINDGFLYSCGYNSINKYKLEYF